MKHLIFIIALIVIPKIHKGQQVYPAIPIDQPLGGGECGTYLSAKIVNGNPACVAYDEVHGDLLFRRSANYFVQGQWLAPVTVDYTNDVGKYCSMEIVNGHPAVAYYDDTYDRLLYIRAQDASGTAWGAPLILEDAPNQKPVNCSMRVINGRPAIAFMDSVSMDLKFVSANDADGLSWGTPQTLVSAGQVGISTCLLSVNGKPAVTYSDATNGSIYFIRAIDSAGTTWGAPVILTVSGDFSSDLDFKIHLGRPVVSYWNQASGTLRITLALDSNGTNWTTPLTIDYGPNVGRYPSILSYNNRISVAYQSAAGLCAKYISSIDSLGTIWNAPSIATQGGLDAKHYSDILIATGCPLFFYNDDFSTSSTACTIAFDTIGAVWYPNYGMFTPPDPSGKNLSMKMVGSWPCGSAVNERNNKVLYYRATDNLGTGWSKTTISSTNSINCNSTSLCDLNNYPAIAYTSSTSNRISFIRALDPLGNTWSNPKRVDSTSVAQNCHMEILKGRPAIAYFDFTTQQIKFTVAADSIGAIWNPHIAPITGSVSSWFDFEVINGKPALLFISNGFLKYMIATDSLGSSWASPVIISSNCSQPEPSLCIVGGKPAVAFQDDSTYLLAYCRSNDANGTTWNTPEYPSPTAFGGFCSKLFVVNNRACIAFSSDLDQVDLIIAADSTGTLWDHELFVDSLNYFASTPTISCIKYSSFAGIGYYKEREKYSYYSRICVAPLNPTCSNSNLVCFLQSANLTASGVGTISWYSSSNGGNYLGSGSNFTTPSLSGTTTYYVQDSTCASSSRTPVTVSVIPLPTIFLSGNTAICNGDSTTLYVSGNGDSFLWSTGSINMTETLIPVLTTNYWVASESGGCSDTIFFSLSVTPVQTITQTINLCFGDSITVGNNNYQAAGTYTDTLSTLQLGCDSIVVTTITIQPLIDTSITYTSGMLTSAEPNAQYQWINCTTQQPIVGATSQNFTPTVNGTYAVIINNGNCIDTSECYNVTDVGINGNSVTNVRLNAFYNSSNGRIEFNLINSTDKVLYEIYNVNGAEVTTLEKSGSEPGYFTPNAAGVYIIRATTSAGTAIQRVIAE